MVGWRVVGWLVLLLYSCTAVGLSCCYSRPPPPARPVDRAVDHAPPPSPGCRWAAVVDRPPPPDRSLARLPAIARSPSLARRRSPTIAHPPSLARRRSPAAAVLLGRPLPAVVARPPSPARSLPSIARHRSPAVALVLFCFRNFLIPHAMIPTFHHHILPYFEVGQPLSPSYSQQQQQQQHSITTQHPECLADAELVRFTPSLSP